MSISLLSKPANMDVRDGIANLFLTADSCELEICDGLCWELGFGSRCDPKIVIRTKTVVKMILPSLVKIQEA